MIRSKEEIRNMYRKIRKKFGGRGVVESTDKSGTYYIGIKKDTLSCLGPSFFIKLNC
jgi:hypothetical protein